MYKEFSHYYDKIFQSNKHQIGFIQNRTPVQGRILDLAAGTGNQILPLFQSGYQVYAVEYDQEMHTRLLMKMDGKVPSDQIILGDMRHVEQYFPTASFDTIYCIGNSLVHLSSLNEIRDLLRKTYARLKTGGTVIIQVINYDRILEKRITSLPTIINREDPNEQVEFTRDYTIVNSHKVLFKTRLTVYQENVPVQEITGEVPLYPLSSEDLNLALEDAGFKQIRFYGSFKEEAYQNNAYALVATGIK